MTGAARVPVHVDGARLWNAAVALEVPSRDLVVGATTAMFCVVEGARRPGGLAVVRPRVRHPGRP